MAGPGAADLIRWPNVITPVLVTGAAAAGESRPLRLRHFPADRAFLLLLFFTANKCHLGSFSIPENSLE